MILADDAQLSRWTRATGSDFRIKRDPAKLFGNAVARSSQSLAVFVKGCEQTSLARS
jgi:hypothetical protein